MCVIINVIEGGEVREIDSQGELAEIVGRDRLVFRPGVGGHAHSYDPESCLCVVDVFASLEPEYSMARNEYGEWQVERKEASDG